jgi:hypothetical protein
MAIFITINGPLGVGKTWTVNQLKAYFGLAGVGFTDVNFQEPIKLLSYQLLDIPADFPYDLMKITKYHGFTGREWIIHISERMKDKVPTIWVDKALARIDRISSLPLDQDAIKNRVFVADSQGFEVEMTAIQTWRTAGGHTWIPIGIEPPELRHRRGAKWQDDDSRFNLCHTLPPENVVTDSNEAYWLLKNKLQELGM